MGTHGPATSAEIVSIFGRTTRLLDRIYAADDAGDDEMDLNHMTRRDESIARAIEGVRFCVNAAAALADPALFEVVADAIDELARRDDFADGHRRVAGGALGRLLSAGLEVDDRIAAHARGPHPELRAGIASGLDPRREPDRALLVALVADPATEVREAATRSLSAVAEVPWWSGKWASDPIARLRPEDGSGAAKALRRIGEILDKPRYNLVGSGSDRDTNALFAAIEEAPPALAVEALQSFCRAADPKYLGAMAPILHRMLALEGGEGALDRLLGPWAAGAPWEAPYGLSHVVCNAPAEMREAVCRHLLAIVAAAPWAERAQRTSGACLAANVVALAWPTAADITPVLDVFLALHTDQHPKGEDDIARSELAGALELDGVDPSPVLARLLDARLAGYPGPFAGLATAADRLLERAGAVVPDAAAADDNDNEEDA